MLAREVFFVTFIVLSLSSTSIRHRHRSSPKQSSCQKQHSRSLRPAHYVKQEQSLQSETEDAPYSALK
jgi:hypothetical protein